MSTSVMQGHRWKLRVFHSGTLGFVNGSVGNYDLAISGFFAVGPEEGTSVILPDSLHVSVGAPASTVPEPGTLPLAGLAFGIGLATWGWHRYRTVRGQ